MRGSAVIAVAGAAAIVFIARRGFAEEAPAKEPSRLEARGTIILSAERVLPIMTVAQEHGRSLERTTTQVGLGPLIQPNSIHEVPRLAIDVVVAERLTIGAAPIFTLSPQDAGPDVFALGVASRVGYVISLSRAVSFWPHAGPAFAYAKGVFATGSQLMISGELPLVFALAEHAALSLGLSGGAPITNETRAGEGPTNLASSYAGLNGGLLGWF